MMSSLSLPLAGPAPLDLSVLIPRLRASVSGGVFSAIFAPAAMLVGAVGLLGVWAVAPRWPISADTTTAPVGRAAPPSDASLAQAAFRDDLKLSRLLIDLGAPPTLTTPPVIRLASTAAQVSADLHRSQAVMIVAADRDAQARLTAGSAAFRGAGLDARSYAALDRSESRATPPGLHDIRTLTSELGVDVALAREVQHAARDLIAARNLSHAAAALPLATPVDDPVRSSPFGTRIDPFTGQAAFHPGQDFSGHYGEPIHVTAPGVVSFVGERSGYGNCVEVDHGYGLKTRYGHMSAFGVAVGQTVATGDTLGFMGSTGRSTGVHLHYEVWASGRLQNPARFLKVGATVLPGGIIGRS